MNTPWVLGGHTVVLGGPQLGTSTEHHRAGPQKNYAPLPSPGESPPGALSRLEGLHPSWGAPSPPGGYPRGQETERTKSSTNPLKNGTNKKKSWGKRTSKKKKRKKMTRKKLMKSENPLQNGFFGEFSDRINRKTPNKIDFG